MNQPNPSHRIANLSESQTIAMAKKARELASQGLDIINLSLGEPDFATPAHICEGAVEGMKQGYTHYPPIAGYADLRTAIAQKLRDENGLPWQAANIIVSTGAKQSIANAVLCLINPGDEVIILSPFWVSYLELVKLAEGVPVIVKGKIEHDFKPTADQIRAVLTPKTKAIMFSSPCNPTGSVFSREELEGIAQILRENPQMYAISDEIYELINFDGNHVSLGSLPGIADQVVTVNGFSKGFAMTGWRLGYMAATQWIADACDKMQGQFTSATCSIAQRAALAAITGDKNPTLEMAAAFKRRRTLVVEKAKAIPGLKSNIPAGAFYLFPDVTAFYGKSAKGHTIRNSTDMCAYLLEEAHVSLVPGEAFGDDDCVRISFAAADEKLAMAMDRIKAALALLA